MAISIDQIKPGDRLSGLIIGLNVTVSHVEWHGDNAINLIYKDDNGALVTAFSAAGLGAELSTHLALAWSQSDLRLDEVWGYFTRHTYLPKLVSRKVLEDAVRNLPGSILVGSESFAVAESFDPEANRYKGLVLPEDRDNQVQPLDSLLIIQSDKANAQREIDLKSVAKPASATGEEEVESTSTASATGPISPSPAANEQMTRFFGSVTIDPKLYGRDFTSLSREVLDRLADSDVELEITVEIQAKKRSGFDANVRRTVNENAKALKFDESSFEAE